MLSQSSPVLPRHSPREALIQDHKFTTTSFYESTKNASRTAVVPNQRKTRSVRRRIPGQSTLRPFGELEKASESSSGELWSRTHLVCRTRRTARCGDASSVDRVSCCYSGPLAYRASRTPVVTANIIARFALTTVSTPSNRCCRRTEPPRRRHRATPIGIPRANDPSGGDGNGAKSNG